MSQASLRSEVSNTRRHVADVLYDAASRVASSHAVESTLEELPALSLYTFVTSLMTIGSRVMKMGKIELGLAQIISWKRPALTLSVLIGYSVLCYHPQWLVLLPLFYFTFFVLVPNYSEKFKLVEPGMETLAKDPLQLVAGDNEEEKKKQTKTLLTAIRQGQKSLAGVVAALDRFDEFRDGPAKFADAQVSSMMLIMAISALFTSAFLLSLVSVPMFFCSMGWIAVGSKHPLAKMTTEKLEELEIKSSFDPKEALDKFISFCHRTVLLDEKPLRRQVEVYELQPQGLTARQWDAIAGVYSSSPCVLGSAARSNRDKPQGASDIVDVIPPEGWYFDLSDDWARDENATVWTSVANVTQVEVSGAWAYDVPNEVAVWRRCRWTRWCYYDPR